MATTYTVTITSGNAAFGSDDRAELFEVAAILRRLANQLDNDDVTDVLLDSNGNTVGRFVITPVRECGVCAAEEGEHPQLDANGWQKFSTAPFAPSPYDEPTDCHITCIHDYITALTNQVDNEEIA